MTESEVYTLGSPVEVRHRLYLLWAVVLGGSRLQEDRGGVSINVGGAPLYAPPLHPQLFSDFFNFSLQQAFLCF